MSLTKTCILQPVLATVLSLVLIILGLVAYQQLELRYFPVLKLPVINIHVTYEGASPHLMESQVSTLIENSMAGIDGVQSITSDSGHSWSNVTILFNIGGNLIEESSAVRDKVAGLRSKLPSNAEPPSITVGTKGSALMGMGFTDKTKSPQAIREYIRKTVQPQLQQVAGVGEVDVLGASDYALRIWLNASKMAALNVTVTDVKTALLANNIDFSAGSMLGAQRNYGIIAQTQLRSPDAFARVVIRNNEGHLTRVKDIAKIELGNRSLYDYPLFVGKSSGIQLTIKPLQGYNPIEVATAVKKEFTRLQKELPPGMQAGINYDISKFLKSSIHDTIVSIFEAVALVIMVVFLFLGSFRAAIIPIATIPVSLIGVFAVVYLLGFSINMMSLLGIVLAIGLVVDDAIVMLENIHRHTEQGMAPLAASIKGSQEISGAVVAMALTLVAVYAPIGFTQGVTAELFKEFAFTLAAAVTISAGVALTLSPMMCSQFLVAHQQPSAWVARVDLIFIKVTARYQKLLEFIIERRRLVFIALGCVALLGYGLMQLIHAEFLPQEDAGMIQVSVSSPPGANMNYTKRYTKQVVAIVQQDPAILSTITQVGFSSIQITGILKPYNERHILAQKIVARLNPKLGAIPGVTASAYVPDPVDFGVQGSDVDINLSTIKDYTTLLPAVKKLESLLKNEPSVEHINTNLKFSSQQYAITINRDLAAELGVSIQDIGDTVSAMMSGSHWTDIQSGNYSYAVVVQMRKKDLMDFNGIKKLYVRNAAGTMIPLGNLIHLKPIIGQGNLYHFNRFRAALVTARLAPGYSEGQAIARIKKNILPRLQAANLKIQFSGKAQQFLDSQGSVVAIVVMSLLFIYLVLAAQFGSFIDPMIVLFAVPLSIVGALFSLWLIGGTLNLYSQIGLVTLIGLISKHGILITQFINNLRQEGMPMAEAIIQGACIRLRPILMTTFAMVFGAVPLAFASGPGSAGRHQIGCVIVGGLIFGTFFSLFVVPLAYTLLGRFKNMEVVKV